MLNDQDLKLLVDTVKDLKAKADNLYNFLNHTVSPDIETLVHLQEIDLELYNRVGADKMLEHVKHEFIRGIFKDLFNDFVDIKISDYTNYPFRVKRFEMTLKVVK